MKCGCHCIKCGSTKITFQQIGEVESDGYYDMHHTCDDCKAHFDHLDGQVFDSCDKCNYKIS